MAETGSPPSPPPADGVQRHLPGRFRLHPPSLIVGIVLGVIGSLPIMVLWQQARRPGAAQSPPPPTTGRGQKAPTSPPSVEAGPVAVPSPVRDASKAPGRNSQVDALLNSADLAFRSRMDGCPAVSLAIRLAREPDDVLSEGRVGPEQRQEIRRYAERCGLRF